MAAKLNRSILFRYLNCVEYQCGIFGSRKFSVNKICYNKKLTMKLLPEVESSLESGEMKHRHHPGIRKITPLSLPDVLKTAVDNIICDQFEKTLIKDSIELCNHLFWRRLPIEKEEIDKKVLEKCPEFYGEYEELSLVLTKQQLKELRRSISVEAGKWKPIEYNEYTCRAYLVGRLSANYASVSHVFDELIAKEPTFKPETYFDFGSGVGSALWAAHSKWSDTIKEYFCTDISPDMNDLCLNLITDEITEEKHINPVFFRQFLPASDAAKYDLVVSAFSLLELQNMAERLKVIDTLWRKTKQFLVIIEYGTVAGFSCVLDARDYILKVENDNSPEFSFYSSGAHVISPCPHDSPCPKFMEKRNSSCGFPVPFHPHFPRYKQQEVWKDWISYVVIKKGPRPPEVDALPRIVKPVLKRPRHVICRLCCSDGNLKELIVTKCKHGRHAYRCARESKQGDILPAELVPVEITNDIK